MATADHTEEQQHTTNHQLPLAWCIGHDAMHDKDDDHFHRSHPIPSYPESP